MTETAPPASSEHTATNINAILDIYTEQNTREGKVKLGEFRERIVPLITEPEIRVLLNPILGNQDDPLRQQILTELRRSYNKHFVEKKCFSHYLKVWDSFLLQVIMVVYHG
jgi:hypothetical protein